MRDVFGIDNSTLDALASEPDDNRLVARFKAAAVNAPGLLSLYSRRGFAESGLARDADAAVRATREDIPVRPAEIEAGLRSRSAGLSPGPGAGHLEDVARGAIDGNPAEMLAKGGINPLGVNEDAWLAFLEAFHRHSYFLGSLRGAGSEVGRALRTLQHIQKVGKGAARSAVKAAKEAVEKVPEPQLAKQVAQTATDEVSRMESTAQRTLFLGKLIDHGGDIGDLSRFTRAKSGSVLTRLDAATGELRGNLFTAVTGITNAGSAFAVQGLRATAMALASLKALALSPFGKVYSQAARVQTMVTWAYVDGTMGAWRDAWRNTLALMEREGMEEVVLNAEGWGLKGLAHKAAGLADEGRRAVKGNFERVDISNRERAFAMTTADMKALNEIIDGWDTPALMQHSMKFVLKAIRPVVNAFGSASRLGTILFVNGADQFAGTVAAKAGAQAEAMRIAASEAAELQLEGRSLGDYMKARMVQLVETTDGFADDAYSAGQQQVSLSAGSVEAKGALFQDQLETAGMSHLVNAASRTPFFHLLVPFVKTPLRILERTAIDFTPLGFLKDRVRADVMAGGWRRDEALARIGLGTLMVYTAFQMAEDRQIVGNDGDFTSSARLSRPSYSFKVGDDVIEFKRFDPVGTLLGWGADLRAYLDHEQDKAPDERGSRAEQIIEAAVWATQANVLSKTWLTSLRDLVQLASDVKEGQSADGWGRYLQSFATRFVPAAGIQRTLTRDFAGADREASGFIEGVMRNSVGAVKLPVKRDQLGDPVRVESGDRLIGLKAGPGASPIDDPLHAELERLSFDLGKPSRSFHGVRLNSAQYSRYLELRGKEVRKDSTGMNMTEALTALIKLPEYQALPRAGKVQAMRDEMAGYTSLASQRLVQEDHDLARRVAANQVWDQALLQGSDQGEVDRQTQELFQQLGLAGDTQPTPDNQ
jgi:hypothetical protein